MEEGENRGKEVLSQGRIPMVAKDNVECHGERRGNNKKKYVLMLKGEGAPLSALEKEKERMSEVHKRRISFYRTRSSREGEGFCREPNYKNEQKKMMRETAQETEAGHAGVERVGELSARWLGEQASEGKDSVPTGGDDAFSRGVRRSSEGLRNIISCLRGENFRLRGQSVVLEGRGHRQGHKVEHAERKNPGNKRAE